MTAPKTVPIPFAETDYGFRWGAGTFERGMSDDRRGAVWLLVTTPKAQLQVYATKTGKVRIHDSEGREWLPK